MNQVVTLASGPLTHVVQHDIWTPGGYALVTNQTVMMLAAALLLIIFLPRFVKQRAGTDTVGRLTPTGWGNAIEGLCEALRTKVARPALGPYTDQFMPYIWSAFFFVLTCNVLGLIPLMDWYNALIGAKNYEHYGYWVGGTPTGNIWVTAALACCTLFMILYNGLRLHGMAFVKHHFMGPPGLNVFIALLELVGYAAKTFALCVRLFANMVAGHVMLAVIIGFVGAATSLGMALGISIPVILGCVALNFLELFVAFLQAFIFTFLSAMFIGQAVNMHHDDHVHAHEADSHASAGTSEPHATTPQPATGGHGA